MLCRPSQYTNCLCARYRFCLQDIMQLLDNGGKSRSLAERVLVDLPDTQTWLKATLQTVSKGGQHRSAVLHSTHNNAQQAWSTPPS